MEQRGVHGIEICFGSMKPARTAGGQGRSPMGKEVWDFGLSS